ncbi:GNAT family N-acetyltransferase [Ruegeria pomeroyi]|jgi:RimJ/RimL family protein N-acetyltransferase|uniref:Acetyltransferase, GNAT family n=2 Tax=Ruegeria pomeroyi TaxID=89184 RepID=Q5LNF5_RUEPO|nr:GNAT family N-acetyltransferase [Ruegeria pomeroyi]HCE71979.1 N-acetyltransferase [Ruegeria sp.]AAV96485.1 acetyltransferase, GNAT family [Ruegeria pomeroyi DSS-3]NVK95718.1 GNAT family N-acetyltransferase [Ruegeria pomeroyi]NVL03787.1 GNAT family N-acetyltransferase [Ruegeria pomeroyi]QWV10027.1 GNAT family N-acetyltransferase [Ruegeria pomeroyi]
MTLSIPVIETERLILRGPRESDFEAFAAFGASDRSRFVGGPFPRFRSWGGFLATYGHWALRGYGMWMVEERATGATAGRIGFIFNDGWDEPELGWHIFDGFEGKGYAYQAASAARAHGAQHFGLDGVISYIDPANTRSLRLAERLGAQYERDGEVAGHPCQVWRHPHQGAAA